MCVCIFVTTQVWKDVGWKTSWYELYYAFIQIVREIHICVFLYYPCSVVVYFQGFVPVSYHNNFGHWLSFIQFSNDSIGVRYKLISWQHIIVGRLCVPYSSTASISKALYDSDIWLLFWWRKLGNKTKLHTQRTNLQKWNSGR